MPKKFVLRSVGKTDFRWEETASPFGTLQFRDVTGDEYWSGIKIYRIALVGRGSAIAYYLSALAPRSRGDESDTVDLHRSMVIFGRVDPWSQAVRGDGYINHEEHLVGHWGRDVAGYSDEYMRRAAFVHQNAAAFYDADRLGAEMADVDVISINKRGDVYQIFTKNYTSYYAAFVVTAMGLGPHRGLDAGRGAPRLDLPRPASQVDVLLAQHRLAPSVMDLDRFMRTFVERDGIDRDPRRRLVADPELTIAVQGPNAGIDAVQRAWQLGHNVLWLAPAAPKFLAGNRLPISRGDRAVDLRTLSGGSEVLVSPGDRGKVMLRWTEASGPKSAAVDVFVISVGQDPMAPGAAGDVLFQRGNLRVADLRMIWDFDQVFGLPFQTLLGYQIPGRRRGFGLQIIGATCEVLTRTMAPTFTRQRLFDDFYDQLTPIGVEPTLETSNAQIDASPSLTRKWGGRRAAFHEERHRNWTRAVAQQRRFITLAQEYLTGLASDGEALMTLLKHQFDPSAAPAGLGRILEDLGRVDPFLAGQVATSERPATTAGASIVLPSQLGAVRAVVAALNAFIPEYILRGDSNFTTDDRNMLAVYIAQNFQGFTADEANARVAATMSLRRSDATPLGFHDDRLRRTIQARWRRESSGR